jgi:hypothetical protein
VFLCLLIVADDTLRNITVTLRLIPLSLRHPSKFSQNRTTGTRLRWGMESEKVMPNVELLWNGTLIPAHPLTLLFPSAPPVLAQFAYGFGVGSLLGVGLVFCGLALYLLRSMRPNLARDHDIFFAAVSLLCGGILFFQGWRLDPILQFGQFLMTGSAIFFAVESIRLRGIVTQQAKRTTPIVDDDRPVSSNYRTYDAELEEIEPYEAPPAQALRRIAGSRDGRRTTRSPREADAGYDEMDRRPRPARPEAGRPADPRSPDIRPAGNRPAGNRPAGSRPDGNRPPRRPDAARDLNLRYDAAPDAGYGDEYGDGGGYGEKYGEKYGDEYGDRYGGERSSRSSDRPSGARRPDSRSGRPSRPTGEMEATLEGYDTYKPTGSDRPASPDAPYTEPTASRYDDAYGSAYEADRNPYTEEPPSRRPVSRSSDRGDTGINGANGANRIADATNDDYAEFYRDDDDYDTPRTASGSASDGASGATSGEPEYDV